MSASAAREFCRRVTVRGLEAQGRAFSVEAGAEERRALGERFGLMSLDRLVGAGLIRPHPGRGGLLLEGRMRADVVQACVVTLAPVPGHLDVRFERLYTTDDGAPADGEHDGDISLTLEDAFPPEPVEGDAIDVGEVLAHELSLALDPFPRAAGAVFEGLGGTPQAPDEIGPFAALARRRDRSVE
ncbi:MAG: DUF177 domain-containing protein [Rhodospirillales bacterium]